MDRNNAGHGSSTASILRHGDLVSLSLDGFQGNRGYLASKATGSSEDNSDGSDLCVLPMESDGSFPTDFQSRCVYRIEFTEHGYESAGEPVLYGANGNGIRLIHVQTQRYVSCTSIPNVSTGLTVDF